MTEIEITISDTEFTLKNGFTLCTPFEVCAIASLDMDGDEIDSMALEAVVGAKGQVVPVNVSDFICSQLIGDRCCSRFPSTDWP